MMSLLLLAAVQSPYWNYPSSDRLAEQKFRVLDNRPRTTCYNWEERDDCAKVLPEVRYEIKVGPARGVCYTVGSSPCLTLDEWQRHLARMR